ncbi:unnamed protein product [Lampetra fluviatilis]
MLASPGAMGDFTGIKTGDPSSSVAKPTAASPSACSGTDADSPGPSFAALRPFCVAVTRFPSRDTLRSLAGALSRVPDPHLRRLLDYVLFAPRHALRRADAAQRGGSSAPSASLDAALEHLRVAAAECMAAVLSRAPVSDGRLLGELLTELCALCDDRGSGGVGVSPSSEEVKLAALTALAALLRCAEPAAAAALYDDDDDGDDARPPRTGATLARLGHAVSTLLAVAEGEGERALRLLALECLAALWLLPCHEARAEVGGVRILFSQLAVGVEEEVEVVEKEEEEGERNAIATREAFDSLASFLPGTATALCRIVTTCGGRAATQPGAVAAMATRLLAHAVARAAPDDLLTPDPREPAVRAAAARGDEGGGTPHSLLVKRTPDWARATGERLAPLLLRLGPVAAGHRAWRVRLEAAALAGHLLRRCRRVLGAEAVAAMLDVVVGLSCDEDQRVRSASFSVLGRRSLLGTAPGDDRAVEESALERAFSLCSSLPRLARSATAADGLKLATLSRLLGYLRLLGPRVSALLRSAPHLSRLARALVQLLAPDTSQQVVVEEEGDVEEEEGGGGGGDGDEAAAAAAAAIACPETPPAGDADVGGHFAARGGVAAGGRAHWPLAGSAPSDWPIPGGRRKRFRGFSDERVHATLTQICRTLGHFGDLYLLVDTFLEMYRESRLQRAAAAMILNEVIVGAAGRGLDPWAQEELFWLARAVVAEYTSPANWRLPTTRLGNSAVPGDAGTGATSLVVPLAPAVESECTLEAFNGNAWQLSAQLEGIAGFAGVLGLDFRPMLAVVLYPVLEKVGDTQPVCCTARRVTRHVARACGYARPGLLVSHNSDYVASAVTIALRHLGESESAPLVLAAVLRYGEGPDSVLQAAGSAQELLSLVDRHPARLARSAAPALHALACALDKWFPGPDTAASERRRSGDGDAGARPPGPQGPRGEEGRSACSPEEVAAFLRDHHRQTQLATGNEEEFKEGEELKGEELKGEEEDAGYDKKPALPPQLELCGALLERSVHLLSHHDVAVRLTMLEVVRLAMGVLSAREDSCLPMAHRLWPALVQRLTGDEWRVILAAFKTLVSLSRVCGDFLRRRVSGELLGPVASSLAARAAVSAAAGAEGRRRGRGGPGGPPLYPRSLACRLQAAALDSLGPLAVALRLDNADLDTVVTAALPYLSCHQPMVLQEAAMGLLRSVMAVDPDRVWLSLCQLHCPHDLQPPREGFRPVQFARSASSSSPSSSSSSEGAEFAGNVLSLLALMDDGPS